MLGNNPMSGNYGWEWIPFDTVSPFLAFWETKGVAFPTTIIGMKI